MKKVVWAIGGDGWAYDIGYGGLDHVLASGEDINILVLDTEVYSNTGGQMSKSTPLGATAEFCRGRESDAQEEPGADDDHVRLRLRGPGRLRREPRPDAAGAERGGGYKGPSLVVAYATCIAQGFDMSKGIDEMARAVSCGHWPLFRYNPDLLKEGKNPLIIDSQEPSLPFKEYAYGENRYRSLRASNPELAATLVDRAQEAITRRWSYLKHLAAWTPPGA